MMNYQFFVRNQRSKGVTVKQALQFALLLAVGIWLLYQINRSHGNHQETTLRRLKEERGSNILGRKGTGRWSDNTDMYLKDVNLMAESEKKESKESHVYEDSNIAIQVGQEDEVTSNKGMLKEDFIEKEMGSSAEGIEEKIKDPGMNKDNITGNLVSDSEGAGNEKDKSELLLKRGGLANTTTTTSVSLLDDNNNPVKENDDESHSFYDETGVPQDPNDESTELGNQSRIVERLPIEDFERSGL